jgi:hypothetical protein
MERTMSVDARTRIDSQQKFVPAQQFFSRILPEQLNKHWLDIEPGGSQLILKNFCFDIEGQAWTLSWCEDHIAISAGHSGKASVKLSPDQLSDLINDQITPIALMTNQLLDMPEGQLADLLNWWLVLRAAIDGRRIYKPGDVTFKQEVTRSFTLEDSDEEMREFLEDVGYLHITDFFTPEEMALVEADFETAAPHFKKGDPLAWFATLHNGEEALVRMEGFERYSPSLTTLLNSDRFRRIGNIPGVGHVSRSTPGPRAAALSKPIGVIKGISDVPWHKDCSLGRHSYECNSMTVGISVTGADKQSGQLRVLPGSHRALIWPAPCIQPDLDLEPLDLPTTTGDVTVHLSCTQHMSQAPITDTRKVVYTGFEQAPADAKEAQRNRQRISEVRSKTHTSISQQPGHLKNQPTK